MKHKTGKTLALLLALALLVGLLPGMGITAYALELSEGFDTTTDKAYTGEHFTITSVKENDGEGIYCRALSPVRIEARNGDMITRVELTIGYYGGYGRAQYLTSDHGTLSYENDEDGAVISFVNVNSPSIEISSSVFNYLQFSSVVVYYYVADSYTVTYDPGEGSGTMNPTTVARTPEGKYPYVVESCGFTAPQGKMFDCWKGSDGVSYTPGAPVELTGNLTLTAQWKDDGSSGSGIGADIVFNIPGMDYSWEYVGGGYAVPQRAYRVSFAPMQGGSAYFALNSGETGETMNVYPQTTVWVRPTPAPGYRLASIVWSMIDGSASYDITQAQNFVMPAMDVVVYVTFQPVG